LHLNHRSDPDLDPKLAQALPTHRRREHHPEVLGFQRRLGLRLPPLAAPHLLVGRPQVEQSALQGHLRPLEHLQLGLAEHVPERRGVDLRLSAEPKQLDLGKLEIHKLGHD